MRLRVAPLSPDGTAEIALQYWHLPSADPVFSRSLWSQTLTVSAGVHDAVPVVERAGALVVAMNAISIIGTS